MDLLYNYLMKKFLGIVVSTLLLSGNAFAGLISTESQKSKIKYNQIYEGMSYRAFDKIMCECFLGLGNISVNNESYLATKSNRYFVIVYNKELAYIIEDPSGRGKWNAGGFANKKLKLIKIFNEGSLKKNWNGVKNFLKSQEGNVQWAEWANFDHIAAYDKEAAKVEIVKKEPKKKEPKKEQPKPSPDGNKVVPAGSGSGFFVSKDGHIITNHHVIEGCNTTKVSFNGNEIEAKILAVDKVNDIAILKTDINPKRIFSVSNEDVSLLEDVIVAGFPLGKKVSAAIKTHKGVVTALAGAGDNYSEFQTDATINQGNSGGPVINLKGNVVGIAVALLDVSAGQNMFFAIKSSTLKQFASSNSLSFIQPNYRELNNKDLGKLITEATVYLECYMSIAKIKQMIALENNKKAFFNEFK